MLGTILTSVISFISTNIDDLFVLMFLYLQVNHKKENLAILIGRYVGTAVILAISVLGAFGLRFISEKYLGLLGIVPIVLGVKEWIDYRRKKNSPSNGENEVPAPKHKRSHILSTAVLAVSNGADNIGVYIPLLTGFSSADLAVFLVIFTLMTALWCFLSAKSANLPLIKEKLQRYRNILVPIIFIVLGIYIILKSYL